MIRAPCVCECSNMIELKHSGFPGATTLAIKCQRAPPLDEKWNSEKNIVKNTHSPTQWVNAFQRLCTNVWGHVSAACVVKTTAMIQRGHGENVWVFENVGVSLEWSDEFGRFFIVMWCKMNSV